MRIENQKLLDTFRTPGLCEICTRICYRREPHHVFARGVGDARRLDIRTNLIALGSHVLGLGCFCHQKLHTYPWAGGVDAQTDHLLGIIARREGDITVGGIIDLHYRFLQLPDETTEDELDEMGLLTWCKPRSRLLPGGDLDISF